MHFFLHICSFVWRVLVEYAVFFFLLLILNQNVCLPLTLLMIEAVKKRTVIIVITIKIITLAKYSVATCSNCCARVHVFEWANSSGTTTWRTLQLNKPNHRHYIWNSSTMISMMCNVHSMLSHFGLPPIHYLPPSIFFIGFAHTPIAHDVWMKNGTEAVNFMTIYGLASKRKPTTWIGRP